MVGNVENDPMAVRHRHQNGFIFAWKGKETVVNSSKIFKLFFSQDDDSRQLKRNVVRYTCLSITETYRMISIPVKKRFPTRHHLVDAGLMTKDEMNLIEHSLSMSEYASSYWMPLVWAGQSIREAEEKGMLCERYAAEVMNEIAKIRSTCGDLISYDWISIPMVYTQLVTIAVYSYFFTALIGRQYLGSLEENHLTAVPVFLILEFVFFVGWLKAAECLLNPYGEDDDDFEMNQLIDSILQASYLYVDMV